MTLQENIIDILKNTKGGMHVDMITQMIAERDGIKFETTTASEPDKDGMITILYPERDKLKSKITAFLGREAKKKGGCIAKVRDPKTHREKRGVYRFVQRRDQNVLPVPTSVSEPTLFDERSMQQPQRRNTNFFGKAGEYSVLGELLFHDYNANIMAVDEGIDIYATKDNLVYFIQVKTSSLDSRKTAHFGIKRSSFENTQASQVRYIFVIRGEKGEMRYFTFNIRDIDRLINDKLINGENDTINLNIRYDADGRPYLYRDNKSQDISFYQNNFNL